MSTLGTWIFTIGLFLGIGFLFFAYYRFQARKFANGQRNEDKDFFKKGGGCCH